MTTSEQTRDRLAALLEVSPDVTDTDAARILGVSRQRVAQLRPEVERDAKPTPARAHVATLSDAELLRRVIKQSGKSARTFAAEELLKGERTIRRWLAGDTFPSRAIRHRLEQMYLEGARDG